MVSNDDISILLVVLTWASEVEITVSGKEMLWSLPMKLACWELESVEMVSGGKLLIVLAVSEELDERISCIVMNAFCKCSSGHVVAVTLN